MSDNIQLITIENKEYFRERFILEKYIDTFLLPVQWDKHVLLFLKFKDTIRGIVFGIKYKYHLYKQIKDINIDIAYSYLKKDLSDIDIKDYEEECIDKAYDNFKVKTILDTIDLTDFTEKHINLRIIDIDENNCERERIEPGFSIQAGIDCDFIIDIKARKEPNIYKI